VKLTFVSTFYGWIASVFMIFFAIIFAFNPVQVSQFLNSPPIPYSFALSIILLVDGLVCYYYHYLKYLRHNLRRFTWLPAVVIFYFLAFYSSRSIVNSPAAFMFFALGSLYLSLFLLNSFSLQTKKGIVNVGVLSTGVCAVIFGAIIFIYPDRYSVLPPSLNLIVKISAGGLFVSALMMLFSEAFRKKPFKFFYFSTGVLLFLLFSARAAKPEILQAALPFFVWLAIFFYQPFSKQEFLSNMGSIQRKSLSYIVLAVIIPLLLLSIILAQLLYKNQSDSVQQSIESLNNLEGLALAEHLKLHKADAEDLASKLQGTDLSKDSFQKVFDDTNFLAIGLDCVRYNSVISSQGQEILSTDPANSDFKREMLVRADGQDFALFFDNMMHLFQHFSKDGQDYYLYQSAVFNQGIKEALDKFRAANLELYILSDEGDLIYGLNRQGGDIHYSLLKNYDIKTDILVSDNNLIYKASSLPEFDNIKIVSAYPKEHLKEQLNLIRNTILNLALIAFVFGIIFAYFFAKSISDPILKLTTVMDIKKLNFNLPVLNKIALRPDEIGTLANYFNELYNRIIGALDDLKHENERVRDLLHHKSRLASQLRVEVGKLETLFGSIGDGIIVISSDNKVVMCNQAAEEMTGYKKEELLTKDLMSVFSFMNEKTGEEEASFYHGSIVKNKIWHGSDVLLKDSKDMELPISYTVSPLKNVHGNVSGGIFAFQDMTKERELDRAKTEFVSVAVHQLRGPLTAIKSSIEFIEERLKDTKDENARDVLEILSGSNERLIDLVNDMLNVIRLDSGKTKKEPVNIDMREVIGAVIKEFKLKAEDKGIRINVEIGSKPAVVFVDKDRLRDVIQNLVDNAIKYTPEQGNIAVLLQQLGKEFVLSIQDSGIGIPKFQQKSLFGKFFRATNAQASKIDGTGLGLYVAKQIVEQAGGKILVESEEAKGSTFTVTLPEVKE